MHGYSSSEESEDPRRPRNPPSTTQSTSDQKKQKKKKPPPQQSINRIWKSFQNRKFNKALAILPFDPVLPPAAPDRANEAVSAGFERAAEECRRKVKKIIQECRRVNMRYRDPGWDLDWDLKMEKGHCLNSLGAHKFQITRSHLTKPSATAPKAVKRVHEIFEQPMFMKKVSPGDAKQGGLGNCWVLAALSGLAGVQDGVQRLCVEYDTRIGIYGFVFYRDGEWIYSIIDDKLYLKSPCWDSPSMQRDLLQQIDREDVENHYRRTYQTGSKALFFGQNIDQNETWIPLLEKAYAKAHGDYASLSGGWIGEGLEDFCGGVTTELLASDILDLDAFWDDEMSRVNEEFLFGCSTGLLDGGYGERNGISEGHAYVVMEARTLKEGQRLVKLRNPWGKTRKGLWEGAWSDGSKEWTADAQQELGHTFGSDSVFWIPYEDLLRKYQHFDRTRLFRDPDWRCCQRWIGAEVPWKAEYHEKFHIKLTKDSPVVLVLSQLDNRYFKGLHGQYTFRLHFRLHEQGRPGAEDYIVRSHGNYLMDRSVSIEVPDLAAGDYSVFISVTGERDTDLPSVESVVKRECKKRVENEKLAQVGYAYDLAHSKATAHLEHVARMRKKADQKKASDCRINERRKQWERRHLQRVATRNQTKKNSERRERKREAAKAAIAETAKVPEPEVVQDISADKQVETKASPIKVTEPETKGDVAEEKPNKEKEAERVGALAEDKDQEKTEEPTASKGVESEDAGENKSEEGSSKSETSAETNPEEEGAGEVAKPLDEGAPEPKALVEETTVNDAEPKNASEAKTADSSAVSNSTGTQQDTPTSEQATVAASTEDRQAVDPVDGSPSPSPPAVQPPQQAVYVSEGESSDSPVEDLEALYSSDDFIRKPRLTPIPQTYADTRYETDDEILPEPWNAICIVGFRVYSKDEDLELRVVMEGGELLEGGMGEKGEKDLDNAQANAGGEREEKSKAKGDGDEPGFALYPTVVVKGEGADDGEDAETAGPGQSEEEDGDDESDDNAPEGRKEKTRKGKSKTDRGGSKEAKIDPDALDFIQISSAGSSTGMNTPEATPLEGDKELC